MRLTGGCADRFRIVAVVLLPPHKGLHILRADQLDLMPQRLELPRPVERARARFQDNRAAIDPGYHRKKFIAHHPAFQNDTTVAINAMKFEHVLGDVHAESFDRHRSSPSRFRLSA